MRNFLTRFAVASVAAWAGSSVLLSSLTHEVNWSSFDDLFYKWDAMPQPVKIGCFLVALFAQKLVPNFNPLKVLSLFKGNSSPQEPIGAPKAGTKFNLGAEHVKYAARWLAGAAMVAALGAAPYLVGNDWVRNGHPNLNMVQYGLIAAGAIPALAIFRAKTAAWGLSPSPLFVKTGGPATVAVSTAELRVGSVVRLADQFSYCPDSSPLSRTTKGTVIALDTDGAGPRKGAFRFRTADGNTYWARNANVVVC